jgi:hypothetical protein
MILLLEDFIAIILEFKAHDRVFQCSTHQVPAGHKNETQFAQSLFPVLASSSTMKSIVAASQRCVSRRVRQRGASRAAALFLSRAVQRRFSTSAAEPREADTITDAKGAWWTLQRNEYVDPSVYNTERMKIFAKSWQLVGRADQVAGPGQFVSKVIAGYPIFVIRYVLDAQFLS